MRNQPLSEAQRTAIVKEFAAGLDVDEIAASYDVRRQHVYRLATKRGVHRTARRFPPETEVEIARLYSAGRSLMSLAAEFGCCLQTARDIAARNGATIKNRGQQWKILSEDQKVRIRELYATGLSQQKVADQIGVSQSYVGHFLNHEGLVEPRPGMRYKNGRTRSSAGYWQVLVPRDSHFASMRTVTGYVLEHRLVVAKALGRPLRVGETVHHINGDKDDNRLENLQVRNGNHGKVVVIACHDCGSHNIGPVPLAD